MGKMVEHLGRRILVSIGVLIAIFVVVALLNLMMASRPYHQSIMPLSEFLGDVDRGKVADVTIQGNYIFARYQDGSSAETYASSDIGVARQLIDKGVRLKVEPSDENVPTLLGILVSWLPYFLALVVWWYLVGRPLRLVVRGLDRIVLALESPAAKLDRPDAESG